MSDSPHDPLPTPTKPMRLQRFLAQCGLGSRRDCEELITAGRVTVDGKVVDQLGATVEPYQQNVMLDGERLKVERKKYFLLNKPSGYLCTADDPEGRRVVLDLFPQEGPRLFTVGRLDENTTGLLIVTNDGDLAQKLAHPRYRIFRTYRAQIAGQPKSEVFEQLRQGLFFTEGKFRVHSVKPLRKQKDSTWVEIIMTEGQNREIRRLFARVGHKIMKLERTGYGPLRLGKLNHGEYRELTRDELAGLHAVLQRNKSEEGQAPPPSRASRASSGERLGTRPAGRVDRPRPARNDDRGQRSRSGDGERPARGARPERGDRPGRSPRSETGQRFERGERPAGGPRPERGQRPTQGERPARGTRPERGSRPEQGQRFERGERSEGGARPEREQRPVRGARPPERGQRPGQGERPARRDVQGAAGSEPPKRPGRRPRPDQGRARKPASASRSPRPPASGPKKARRPPRSRD
ncbi:pseudouridine synthase [Planctomicrobium piriforme]|uniref:Pseudouridine synthase n=1 Tax=Planctomicrobium piriforme TaxID=1576369 RepID=A0A1I3C538_9PLAN|nr:pseudouridine synthase [Planctomicrobium piriforme]SFH69657.1 23S rRNA pseudouridine2605 synthase [Planctomicrobium piriforme]